MGNTRNTGYLQNTIKVSDAGAITFMSGSTMLATINTSGQMSGSSPVLFASTASFVGNAQTASFVALAQSASNAVSAQTASFANTFTVASTLTAQTLVVQTITSSVDFVTGSTRFGSILGNTHVFSGSVTMNPGGLFVSSSGNVGIGTTSALSKLTVQDSNNTYPVHISGNGQTNGVAIGTNSSNVATIQGYTRTFSATNNVAINPDGGNVGIGTTTPNSTLQVLGNNGTSTAAVLRLRDTNTTARTTRLQFEDYTGNLADGLIDFRIGTAGNASTATLSIGINSAGLTFNSSNAATFSSSVTATRGTFSGAGGGIFLNETGASAGAGFIQFQAEGVQKFNLATQVSNDLGLYNNGGTNSFNLYIKHSNGNVGIGTNNPTEILHLNNPSGVAAFIRFQGTGGGGVYIGNRSDNMELYAGGSERMRITSGGRVLVGTTTDNGRGNIQTNDNISANNITTFSLTLQGLSTPVSTGLGINAYSGGRTYLLLTSQQWSDGNSTSATITMIRCGYDGNNFSAVVLGSSNATTETWSQSGGILYVTGNLNFQMDITVLSNG